ncbi:MAG: protein translocase subunit SecD [Candidatus Spechtbacteria bacterium]|nr:protein translocase subunit SecD [Candidatus Spechtbacteria bacterium]
MKALGKAKLNVGRFFGKGVGFLLLIPVKFFVLLRFILWPKENKRRYRTALLAVFLCAFVAANIDYPKYWNKFADFVNPKLDAVNLPEQARRLDRWGALKRADEILNLPHFWNVPFSLGLDLQGGIHVIYRADLLHIEQAAQKEAMNGLRDVIERRVNLFGVREPHVSVQQQGGEHRLLVELAGIKDFNKAIELIGKTPFLEFKEERPSEDQKRILRGLFESEVTDEQLLNVCANTNPQFIAVVEQAKGEDPCFSSIAPAPLTGQYLKRATVQFNQNTNEPVVSLELNDEGAKIFEEVTARNVGKPLAIYLDNFLINWPRVQEKIAGGRAQVSGFNIESAKALARSLNAGALPVPITLISQQTIGASLGEASLRASLRAGMIGFLAVLLFMVSVYRVSGFFAGIALSLYVIFLLAIFKVMPVTLTLPGIAGFILSIGMAVDANVLVFERLREELGPARRDGNDLLLAMNRAYARAWSSVRDGHVTTLITCVVLFLFSTSFIKGFALTLGLGVLMSMFSAMIVTRDLMRLVAGGRLGKILYLWIR